MSGVHSMSELDVADGAAAAQGTAEPATRSAGQMLRSAREAAGLHVAALAVSMKIPVKKLEALEADRLDQLHDAVFVRALAASVCRALKIDPAPVLDRLPLNTTPRLTADDRGINTPFRIPGETAGTSFSAWLSRPPVLIVVALLVAAAGVVFFPDIKITEPVLESPSVTNTQAATAEVAVARAPAPAEVVLITPQQESPREAMQPSAPASSVVSVVAMTPAVSAAVASSAPIPVASVPIAPSTGIVVFKARAATWVKVVDAKGVVQLSKTLAQGEVAGASGATPLAVVVGRVDMTDVEVRGQSFSMEGLARENVARFEVK